MRGTVDVGGTVGSDYRSVLFQRLRNCNSCSDIFEPTMDDELVKKSDREFEGSVKHEISGQILSENAF